MSEAHFCYIHFDIPTFEEVWDKYITLSRSRYKDENQGVREEEIRSCIDGNPLLYQCLLEIVAARQTRGRIFVDENDHRQSMIEYAIESHQETIDSFKDSPQDFVESIIDELIRGKGSAITPKNLLDKRVKWTMED